MERSMGFLLWGRENALKLIVALVAEPCELLKAIGCTLKMCELYSI